MRVRSPAMRACDGNGLAVFERLRRAPEAPKSCYDFYSAIRPFNLSSTPQGRGFDER